MDLKFNTGIEISGMAVIWEVLDVSLLVWFQCDCTQAGNADVIECQQKNIEDSVHVYR